ncbi:phage tail protein [Mannheimia haemolytica]|uniref:phage tail protein n=1 Tax=Mannheimia haemolytica TaxID=75985 RepID=UPI00201BA80C|nr:phage tail protein [Mannheimia haemolytica]UQX80672.1 phage tail protein [Mannheimia haemolytica]
MGSQVTGLKELQASLKKIARQTVPKAAAQAIRTVGRQAMNKAVKSVAAEIGVNQKTIKGRARMTAKPTPSRLQATIKVNRTHMPMIRILERKSNRLSATKGSIRVGKYRVQRGFRQRLANGRTHIMYRQGRKRYGIDVAKVPLSQPLTQAFEQELKNYPEQVQAELAKQLIGKL